jgi:hypothetical protein
VACTVRYSGSTVNVPQLGGIFLLNLAALVHEIPVLLQKVDSLLRVNRNLVVLVLQNKVFLKLRITPVKLPVL